MTQTQHPYESKTITWPGNRPRWARLIGRRGRASSSVAFVMASGQMIDDGPLIADVVRTKVDEVTDVLWRAGAVPVADTAVTGPHQGAGPWGDDLFPRNLYAFTIERRGKYVAFSRTRAWWRTHGGLAGMAWPLALALLTVLNLLGVARHAAEGETWWALAGAVVAVISSHLTVYDYRAATEKHARRTRPARFRTGAWR